MIINNCIVKTSARNRSDQIDISIYTSIIKPLPEIYLHVVVYFKYQTYKKFPIDLWDDACAWWENGNRKKQSFVMEVIMSALEKHLKYNGQLRCPLKGNLSVEANGVLINKVFPPMPLIPIGHYLTSIKLFEGDRNTVIAHTKSYIQIIDQNV